MALGFASIGFVVANAAISLLTVLLWRAVRPVRLGAGALFLLRMLPAAGSTLLVLGVIVPAFVVFEPRATSERAGPAILVFAVAAAALVAAGWRRAAVSWLHTRRLERAWRASAVRSTYSGMTVRGYRVASELPLAALVGVFRPRLFVSDSFLDALSAEERQAVLDHEAGHLRSRDNLKRTLMRLAPDGLSLSPAARELEAAWAIAAEEDADDHAAGPDRAHALDLGSALLKASRLAPMPPAFASSFCDGAPIARRVERLLSDPPARRGPLVTGAPRVAWVLGLLAAAAFLATPTFRIAYTMTEAVVRLLR
jgi:beta-lactamase regulating signal transducer with metallopeptidase domain